MSARQINRKIFLNALNSLRVQLFGDDSLKIFEISPETGEAESAEFILDWSGRRAASTTDTSGESGFWQFQIAASDDWQSSQAFMLKAVALRIGARRWKVKKVEKPIGNALVWKVKAEIQ